MNLLIKGSNKAFSIILLVLLFAFGYPAQAQDTPTIIAQTMLAHGGQALGLINNSVMTGQLTDTRINGGQPLSATVKTLGKLNRLEYDEETGGEHLRWVGGSPGRVVHHLSVRTRTHLSGNLKHKLMFYEETWGVSKKGNP